MKIQRSGGMFFSKTFGYALRSILYVAVLKDEGRKIQIDEIAKELSVPRHFLGKIMQDLVKAKMLKSTKGPYGGFSLNQDTLNTSLSKLLEITDGHDLFTRCVLQFRSCSEASPCPLHAEIEPVKNRFKGIFAQTMIGDLLKDDKKMFLKSLMTY